MSSMAFLPQELPGSNERSRVLEFPSHYVGPLVHAKRKVSVRSNPLGKTGIHNSLTSRSDGDGLGQIG